MLETTLVRVVTTVEDGLRPKMLYVTVRKIGCQAAPAVGTEETLLR